MAWTFSKTEYTHLPGGGCEVTGTITGPALYTSGGETVTGLSTYILSTDSPTVQLTGQDGYVLQWDQGTCSAGKVLAYEAGADAAALDECAVNTVLSACVGTLTARGQAA